ncbi:MAG: hypothetical protein AAF292_17145 [Pseudomonadota bacterium]
MRTSEYQKQFVVTTEREIETDRIVSRVSRTLEGKLDSDGDDPAVYKLDRLEDGEKEYRAWYRDGQRHRDGAPAEIINAYGSDVHRMEAYSENGLTHRAGDDDPAVIYRNASGQVTEIRFYTHGFRDRSGGPAVIKFDPETGQEIKLEFWRRGTQYFPKQPDAGPKFPGLE